MALFWFDAKAGIALFQFYKRWRLFRSLFRDVFPFSAIFGETPTFDHLIVWRRKNTNKLDVYSGKKKFRAIL